MARNPKFRPSFFKVLLPEFTSHLRLPPNFMRKYGEILPGNIKLRSSSGEIWNVKIDQIDEKNYRFGEGWTKFAVDAALQFGEFVVFFLNDDNFTFDVTVFGHTACERRMTALRRSHHRRSPLDPSHKDDVVRDDEEKGEGEEDDDEIPLPPRMEQTLKRYEYCRVKVCKEFAEAAGLTTKISVMLRFHLRRKQWPVSTMIYFGKGWTVFRNGNGLSFATYLLEYIADEEVIQVKLLK